MVATLRDSNGSYGTQTYGQHENKNIIPRFSTHVYYYHHHIDDIFGIWIPPTNNALEAENNFKITLKQFGTLKWEVGALNTSAMFLDLNKAISKQRIMTSTHQKPMNLHLYYIPSLSARPPSCLKGLVIGETLQYCHQNNLQNFTSILSLFIKRHKTGP